MLRNEVNYLADQIIKEAAAPLALGRGVLAAGKGALKNFAGRSLGQRAAIGAGVGGTTGALSSKDGERGEGAITGAVRGATLGSVMSTHRLGQAKGALQRGATKANDGFQRASKGLGNMTKGADEIADAIIKEASAQSNMMKSTQAVNMPKPPKPPKPENIGTNVKEKKMPEGFKKSDHNQFKSFSRSAAHCVADEIIKEAMNVVK